MKGFTAFKVKLIGVVPLLLHNGQLADPQNEWAKKIKAITKKRTKTDSDLLELKHLEFMGSLYVNEKGRIIFPSENLEAAIVEAAAACERKSGKMTAQSEVIIEEAPELIYEGPKDPEKLWETGKFHFTCGAIVNRNRVMRTRPRFGEWSLEPVIKYGDISQETLVEWLTEAGRRGLGDWTPKYGRYRVE